MLSRWYCVTHTRFRDIRQHEPRVTTLISNTTLSFSSQVKSILWLIVQFVLACWVEHLKLEVSVDVSAGFYPPVQVSSLSDLSHSIVSKLTAILRHLWRP